MGVMITALLTALLAVAPVTPAATTVHRCVGAHGEMVFSGKPCDAQGLAIDTRDTVPDQPASGTGWIGRCARSAKVLADRVATAFDRQDVNSLGVLFLWRGMGTRVAYRHMHALHQLVRQPLAAVDIGSATSWALDGGYGGLADGSSTWLSISTAPDDLGEGTVEHRYALTQRDACVWLTF